MSKADEVRSNALKLVGNNYTWGDEPFGYVVGSPATSDPDDTDCSGTVYGVFRLSGIRWKDGSAWPRLTANGYRQHTVDVPNATPRVGDVGFQYRSDGTAYHIILCIGPNESVEARNSQVGVVRYRLDDPVNGTTARHIDWRRFAWVNLGEAENEDKAPELRQGASGEVVKQAQQLLNGHLGETLKGTGTFGPKTLAAVQLFQRVKGLAPDGIIGEITWGALRVTPVWPVLRRGSQGGHVFLLAARLNLHGANLQGTGTFGPKTEAAVRVFQTKKGLEVDGVVGTQTWAALRTAP